jgi:hypothetical protein
MELLQSRRYKEKPEEISDYYINELYLQIDQIIELCKEGEIAAFETANILFAEEDSCKDFRFDLLKKLRDMEEGDVKLPRGYIDTDDERNFWKSVKNLSISYFLADIEKYKDYLSEALEKLRKISDCTDYLDKRKLKIKQKIIQDGLSSLTEIYHNTQTPHFLDNNIPVITKKEVEVENIEKDILSSLLYLQKITKKEEKVAKYDSKEKTIPAEYWLIAPRKDVEDFIIDYTKRSNIQDFPVIEFMTRKLKSKKGCSLSASIRTEKSVNKRKTT